MKKALVIFAASSMLATGVSLASNVSFGHKMAAFLSETFEFVGPISGLVNALVKPTDTPKARTIPNFHDSISGPQQLTPNQGGNSGQQQNINKPLRGAGFAPGPMRADSEERSLRSNSLSSRTEEEGTEALFSRGASPSNSGSMAQAITEKGDSTVLANLGKSLQGKFQDTTTGSGKDVWVDLMNKPELAASKLALNSERSHKQIEAGSRIAESITTEGHSQNGAGANQDHSSAGGVGPSTASQMTPSTLAQGTSTLTTVSGKVPLPGGLQLILIGLVTAALTRFTKKTGHNK